MVDAYAGTLEDSGEKNQQLTTVWEIRVSKLILKDWSGRKEVAKRKLPFMRRLPYETVCSYVNYCT